MSTIGRLAALLVLVVATPAFSEPNAWLSWKHSPGPDGVWNQIYSFPFGYGSLEPLGTAFDPTREQLIQFARGAVWFKSVTPPNETRYVAIRNWPGIPTAYSVIYDPRRDRIVVFTVDSLLTHVGTFALPLANPVRWDRLVPFGASPNLSYATAIYDPMGDQMIVYGGVDFSKGYDALGEVWSLSLGAHPQWARLEPQGTAPPPRMDHTAIYDAEHRAMVVYGGRTALQGSVLGDVWSLDLTPRPHWRRVEVGDVAPKSRTGHAAIYDSRWRRMIVMGGRASARLARDQAYHDIWALSLAGAPRWRPLNPTGDGPGQSLLPIAFADASADRMLITNYSGALSFLWTIDWGTVLSESHRGAELEELLGLRTPGSSDAREPSLSLPSGLWRGGALMAHVSLAKAEDASLALFDASGRRLWAAGSEEFALGERDMAVAPGMRLPNGMYFLRLAQGSQARTVKVVRLP